MLTKRGDVVRVLFPNSDLTTAKRRPALVIQADSLNTGLAQTVMAMITSNMLRANDPSRLTVMASSPAGVGAGLRLDSVLGSLPMKEVEAALRHTLGL